jgi:hypothetical protein
LPFLFSFYVNDICFPPLIVTGENHSLTKKPPQRDDIVKARRRNNGAEAVETTARLQQGTIKGFTDFVSRPSPVILAGLAAMSGQQTCGAVGGYAMGRRCRTEYYFDGTLRFLSYGLQIAVVLLNLMFALLLVL